MKVLRYSIGFILAIIGVLWITMGDCILKYTPIIVGAPLADSFPSSLYPYTTGVPAVTLWIIWESAQWGLKALYRWNTYFGIIVIGLGTPPLCVILHNMVVAIGGPTGHMLIWLLIGVFTIIARALIWRWWWLYIGSVAYKNLRATFRSA